MKVRYNPVSVNEEAARQLFLEWLSRGIFTRKDAPLNYLISSSKLKYIPLYVSLSAYEADWGAEIGFYYSEREYNDRRGQWESVRKTRWQTDNGTVSGHFKYSIILSKEYDEKLGLRVLSPALTAGDVNLNDSSGEVVTPDITEDIAHSDSFVEKLRSEIYHKARNCARGDCNRNVSFTIKNLKTNEWLLYVPVYEISYRYEESDFLAFVLAFSDGMVVGKKPTVFRFPTFRRRKNAEGSMPLEAGVASQGRIRSASKSVLWMVLTWILITPASVLTIDVLSEDRDTKAFLFLVSQFVPLIIGLRKYKKYRRGVRAPGRQLRTAPSFTSPNAGLDTSDDDEAANPEIDLPPGDASVPDMLPGQDRDHVSPHSNVEVIQADAANEAQTDTPLMIQNEGSDDRLRQIRSAIDGLIGLDNVKQEVAEIFDLVSIRQARMRANLPVPDMSLHMVFVGNPGTGKTTVARLIAQYFGAVGLLSSGQLVEVDRSGLVAGYVGQTALKTQAALDKATGGVLFIDEAYALADESSNDYGREAVDTILKAMEDRRDDLIVIAAGYTEPMENFLRLNPGLKSRFTRFIHFPDYDADALFQIFTKMSDASGFILDADAREALALTTKRISERAGKNFGNAREMRNLYELAMVQQAARLARGGDTSRDALSLIIADDINAAADRLLGHQRLA